MHSDAVDMLLSGPQTVFILLETISDDPAVAQWFAAQTMHGDSPWFRNVGLALLSSFLSISALSIPIATD